MKALTAFEKFSHDKVEAEVGPIMIELRRLLRTLDRSYLEKLLTEVNTDSMKNARYTNNIECYHISLVIRLSKQSQRSRFIL